ncbi:hypothetical protein DIPPA_16565 [Diplonema papillatum]|nr:hypothetical protein DIPPA_16565 [Diplonema papillatum]
MNTYSVVAPVIVGGYTMDTDSNPIPLDAMLELEYGTDLFSTPSLDVRGAGAEDAALLLWQQGQAVGSSILFDARVTYLANGTAAGQAAFTTGQGFASIDFACGDMPLPSYEAGLLHVPFALGTVSFFVNLPGVGSVYVPACKLAGIFKGTIRTWGDAAQVPASIADKPIAVGILSAPSGSTLSVTRYLAASCPTVWSDPPSATFPESSQTRTEVGTGLNEMQKFLQSTPFSVGLQLTPS